jgi:hypothetical protein
MPKISTYTAAGGLSPADEFPFNQVGAVPVTTKRVTAARIVAVPFTAFADLVNGANQDVSFVLLGQVRAVRLISGPTAGFSIGGIVAPGEDGRQLALWNATGQAMTISNDAGGSSAANRVNTLTGGDLVFAGAAIVHLVYDLSSANWIVSAVHPQP